MIIKFVASSNVDALAYHRGHLYIRFQNGAVYEYDSVPIKLFHEISKADSPGREFNLRIRGHYEYRKLPFDLFTKRKVA